MKIHQLPMGARFELEGEEYVKSGPMFATSPAGQRMIPKYAVLKPLGGVDAAPDGGQSETVLRTEVLKAFGAFYVQCAALVPDEKRGDLEAARGAFLKALAGLQA
jgi:hypothetical protein